MVDGTYNTTSDGVYNTPSEERNLRDLAALAAGRLRLTRCPGGRWTDGVATLESTCAHCGVDYTADPTFCGQPLEEDGMTPFDATVARRIMCDSEGEYSWEL